LININLIAKEFCWHTARDNPLGRFGSSHTMVNYFSDQRKTIHMYVW